MPFDIERVDYYETTVEGHAAEASRLLSVFAGAGVSLLAYRAVPLDPKRTRFTLLPDDGPKMNDGATKAGLQLDGPHPALYVRGNDESGALADIFERLGQVGIGPCESSGLADINGGYGVVLYLEGEDHERAIAALEG
jgi:hypothetical protein